MAGVDKVGVAQAPDPKTGNGTAVPIELRDLALESSTAQNLLLFLHFLNVLQLPRYVGCRTIVLDVVLDLADPIRQLLR